MAHSSGVCKQQHSRRGHSKHATEPSRRQGKATTYCFYRRYRGLDLAALEQRVDTTMAPYILSRLSPDAVGRIQEHRAAGHTTILITGVVRTLTRPLAELFDVIVAAELDVDEDGLCTGYLTTPPLVGESRAAWIKHYASLHDIDLCRSFAYADSHSDLPMLQTVGQPVAVSPDISLDAGRAAQPVVDRGVEDQAQHTPVEAAAVGHDRDKALMARPTTAPDLQLATDRVRRSGSAESADERHGGR